MPGLSRGTELVTGGQRLDRYADYLVARKRAKLREPFEYYFKAMRFGKPHTAALRLGWSALSCNWLG